VAVGLPLVLVGLVILGHRSTRLAFWPPVMWATGANWNPLLMTAAIAVMFAALVVRLPAKRSRPATVLAMGAMLLHYGLMPAALPLMVRPALAAAATRLDSHEICLQAHAYSCGPAAAVTCLRRVGLQGDEGALAIDARCSPAFGTDGHVLAYALTERYGARGLTCAFQYFDSLDQLPTPAVADTVMPLIGGHYVAVLEVTVDHVVVGDPMSGLRRMPREEFLAVWKRAAIVFVTHPVARRP